MNNSASRLPRIAWLSPFPPQRSGIANYSYWLVKALTPYFDIDLYYDTELPAVELQDDFDVYPLSAFAEYYERYDEVIYHLGNNSNFHKRIYELAWHFPGTVVLHDYNLSAFMYEAFYRRNNKLYRQALPDGYGDQDRKEFRALFHGRIPVATEFPMSHAVVSKSRKVIVHHRWVKNQFPGRDHITVIPHFAKLSYRPTEEDIEKFKSKFGIKSNHFVLSCLGFINSNKLPQLQIEVGKRLLDDGYPVQMVFAGELAPGIEKLFSDINSDSQNENIISTGYLTEADYFSAIFASDVIINLRNPSMGEASGTLMHALAAAKPTIVSDVNQYKEFPDSVCWKLTHDENQVELLYEYLKALLSDRNLRAAMSANSADYVRGVLALEKLSAQWTKAILR